MREGTTAKKDGVPPAPSQRFMVCEGWGSERAEAALCRRGEASMGGDTAKVKIRTERRPGRGVAPRAKRQRLPHTSVQV